MSDGKIRQRAGLAMGQGLVKSAPKSPTPGFVRGGKVGGGFTGGVPGKAVGGFKATAKRMKGC